MTVQEPPRFTPAQVIEAGRRAEAEGRTELAAKFYRHIVDNYAGSAEAPIAHGALARLADGSLPPAVPQMNGQHYPPDAWHGAGVDAGAAGPPHYQPQLQPPQAQLPPQPAPALSNPFDAPRPPEAAHPQWQPAAPLQMAPPQPESAPVPIAAPQQTAAVELPRLRREYRTGRALARVVAWTGGLQAALGLALLPLAMVNPRLAQAVPLLGAWAGGAWVGLVLVVSGVLQVMLGQLVRAQLDAANAMRDLAAVARAEAEGRHGSPERGRRKRER